jgi:toxin ParE1/3/4
MMREPVFSKSAIADLQCAKAWYDAQREGLGEEFMLSVEAVVAAIARDPERHRCVLASFRRVRLRRFPYAVYYCLEPGVIFIGAVHHASRDQARLTTRLQNFNR